MKYEISIIHIRKLFLGFVIQKLVLHQWRGCDDKDTVGAMSDTGVDAMREVDMTS